MVNSKIHVYASILYFRCMSKSSNFDQIEPTACVNAKVRRLHRLLNKPYQDLIKPYGLKGSMLSILFMIGKAHVNQKAIAERLVLDQSTMSRDLKKLESMGFIQIAKGRDQRHSNLRITESGYELLEEVSPRWSALHQRMTEAIGAENLFALDRMMEVLENINANPQSHAS